MKYLYTFENNFKIIWCPSYLKEIINKRSYPEGREKDALRASVRLFHCILHRKRLPVVLTWNSLVTVCVWFLQVCWKNKPPTIRAGECRAGAVFGCICSSPHVGVEQGKGRWHISILMSQVMSWPALLLSGFFQIDSFTESRVPPGCRGQRKGWILSLLCSCSLSTASRLHSNVLFCYVWIQPSCSFMGGGCGWYWECAATTKLYEIKV